MIKEKYEKLPELIREKYMQDIEVSQPIKILEHIVFIGKKFGASDVHITGVPYDETTGDKLVKIKYRIDGKLDNYIYNLDEEVRNNPKSYITMDKFDQVMRGIKTAIEMEYNETEVPQDAAYKFEHFDSSGVKIDETKVRVNSMPIGVDIIKKGEVGVHQSLVMRIINDSVDSLPKYKELGIMPTDMNRLDKFLDSQKGALIISGPTGSGKSVFLQVIMNVIASDDKKIHTLEDPIEYRNPLLIQTQIKSDKGFTWQEGIRGLMRQDPDIIMVGEVRDEESAELFIEASLTGHMGFATTHAKTGCGAFDRLKLMGVKPYIIVGGISISASERLSQKLCPDCKIKVDDDVTKEKLENIWEDKFGKFDFSTLTAKDICRMIGDDGLTQLDMFENLYSQFKSSKKKLRKATEEEKVEIQRFNKGEHAKLVKGLKEHFVSNLYNRLEAKEGESTCSRCLGKGVKGRIGIFEFIETTKEIEQQVLEDVPLKHMETYVRDSNILTLDRYGIIRAMRGEIDMQELLKLL